MLIQLIYISRAVTPFSHDQLVELLEFSRVRNARDGLTGLLVYHHGSFMQALEGEEAAVMRLFSKIQRDPRHMDVTQVTTLYIQQRNFGDWKMGFVNLDELSATAREGFDDFFGDEFSGSLFCSIPSSARKLLLAFREGKFRQAVETDTPTGAAADT